MAVDVHHHYDFIPSPTKATRDVFRDASVTSNSVRVTPGLYQMQESSETLSTSGSSLKKRRPSKAKTGRSLARSISTPQLRGHVMSDSDLDKKRNKLGYQRISIACAHCRRRKIRCLVADGDPQSRCQNCIRLKKECVFYPVEQQTAIESKSQSSKAGGGTGASSNVSSSPPDIGAGKPFDERQESVSIPTLPSNAPSGFPSLPPEQGSAVSSQGAFPRPEYSYTQSPDTPWSAQSEFAQNAPALHPDQMHHINQNFMRYHHAVSPGDVAPFYPEGMHPPPNAHVAQHYHHHQPRADAYWQSQQAPPPLLRSMSYDQARTLHSNDPYAVHYQPGVPQQYPMRLAPPSMEMQGAGTLTPTTGPHSAPIRDYRHGYSDHPQPYMLHPEAQAMQNAGARPEYSHQWYQPSPQFAPVTEESPESHYTTQADRPG